MRIALTMMLVAVSALACGGADEAEIARAKAFMEQVCQHEAGDNGAFRGMTLVKSSKPFRAVPGGTMVAVSTSGVTVNDVRVADAATLAAADRILNPLYDKLREERNTQVAIAMRDPSSPPPPLVLAFDAAVPARAVQSVLESAFQSEHRQVLLALEPGVAPQFPEPPDRLLDDELRRIPDDQLPLHGANKMAQLAGDCPPLAELFNVMSFVPPEDRCLMFANAIGEVFGSASCRTDINKVLTLMHAMTIPRKPVTVHQVVLHPDAPGIPTKPTDTWAQVAESLFRRGDDRLWLEPPQAPAGAPPAPPAQ